MDLLRHTQATLLIGKGADIKTVRHRLGHSSASLTMDVFAHAIPSNDEVAAEMVGDMLSGRSAEATPRAAVSAPQTVPAQPAAPAPAPQGDGSIGVSKELIGTPLGYDRHADTGVDLGRRALPRRQLQGLRADAQEGEGVQDARRLAGRAVQRKVGALCGKLGIDPADLSLLGGDASMLT